MTTIGKQLFSNLDATGMLTLEVVERAFPEPLGNQVLVRVEAAPINPSDLLLLTEGVNDRRDEWRSPVTSPISHMHGPRELHRESL